MSHGADKRLSSRRWKKLRERVLRRDMHRCRWGLEGCTEFADQADHVVPRSWMAETDPRFWDEANLVASCGHCNRKRQSLGPGEPGSPFDGVRPKAPTLLPALPAIRGSVAGTGGGPRWPVIRTDYTRPEVSRGAGSR